MKIDCNIYAVESDGVQITVKAQGHQRGAADWRPMNSVTLQIDETAKNQKAFHLGRNLTLTIEPKA